MKRSDPGDLSAVTTEVKLTRSRHRVGELLRRKRDLSDKQLQQIAAYQREHGVRFGEAAVALKLVTSDDVLVALSEQYRYAVLPGDGPLARNKELVTAADPFSQEAEGFRQLRTDLLEDVLSGDVPRALAIVSPRGGEGKSYVASNLAVTFSQLGAHTLLIDANMRTPAQHRLFGLNHTGGLSGVLSGRGEGNVVHPTPDLPALYILPAGPVPPNPLELLQQNSFRLLVEEMLERFEHVIIDTPASAQGADARVIAAVAGAAVVVGRKDQSRIAELQGLLASLAKGHAKVAGVVVNDY